MPATSTDRSLQGAFAPINSPTTSLVSTVGANTIGTTPTILAPDKAGDAIRRFSVVNRHATNTLAVWTVPAGVAAAGTETVDSGRPITPGGSWDFLVHSSERVYIVASGASTSFGGIVHDL